MANYSLAWFGLVRLFIMARAAHNFVFIATVWTLRAAKSYKICVRWWMFKIHHDKLCAKIENEVLFFCSLSVQPSLIYRFFAFTHIQLDVFFFSAHFASVIYSCMFVLFNMHKLCHTHKHARSHTHILWITMQIAFKRREKNGLHNANRLNYNVL